MNDVLLFFVSFSCSTVMLPEVCVCVFQRVSSFILPVGSRCRMRRDYSDYGDVGA